MSMLSENTTGSYSYLYSPEKTLCVAWRIEVKLFERVTVRLVFISFI